MGGLCQHIPKKVFNFCLKIPNDWQQCCRNTQMGISDYLQHTWQDGDQKLQGMIPTAKGNALRKCNTLVNEMCGEKMRNTWATLSSFPSL